MIIFGRFFINNKKWKQDLVVKSLYYRTEIIISIISFALGFVLGLII
tara:strand:- start:264 stop:404 length:141 start_codon:yes stop_codon:yes gene_type:complete